MLSSLTTSHLPVDRADKTTAALVLGQPMAATEQPQKDIPGEEEEVEDNSNTKAVRNKNVGEKETVLEESVRKMFLRWQQKTLEGRSQGQGVR